MDNTIMAKELDTAVAMLSTISVSHDAVDMMAAAKAKIRRVSAELSKQPEKEEKSDG